MALTFTFMWWLLEKPWRLDVVLAFHTFFRDSHKSPWLLVKNLQELGNPTALCRNVYMELLLLIFHSITRAHPPPLLNIFLSSPLLFSCLCVPLNLIRIDCVSMGLGYLQECGQVISGYTTKFTPSSSSSRCPKFPGGAWGFMNPSPVRDAMLLGPILCRTFTDERSSLWFMSREGRATEFHSTPAHHPVLRFFLPPSNFCFWKLEIFHYKIVGKANLYLYIIYEEDDCTTQLFLLPPNSVYTVLGIEATVPY